MLNLKRMKSNKSLSTNVSLLKGFMSGKKALILTEPVKDVDASPYKITDFFDVVIAETVEAMRSVPFCDFKIYSAASLYKDGLFYIESEINKDTILCINYTATEQLSRLGSKPKLGLVNINYLPSSSEVSADAHDVRGVKCGLSASSPGRHLAEIMGCTTIMVDPSNLQEYVSKVTRVIPDNLVAPNRQPMIKTKF